MLYIPHDFQIIWYWYFMNNYYMILYDINIFEIILVKNIFAKSLRVKKNVDKRCSIMQFIT